MQSKPLLFCLAGAGLLLVSSLGVLMAQVQRREALNEASEKTRQALVRIVPLDNGLRGCTSLGEAMQCLGDRSHVEIRMDEAAFRRIGRPLPTNANLDLGSGAHKANPGVVLQLLLEQVDSDMDIRNGIIWIVPLAKPRGLAARLQPSLRSFEKKLEKRISLEKGIDAETPLSDVLEYLSDNTDISFYLDTRAFQAVGVRDIGGRPIKLGRQLKTRLTDVLTAILDEVNATYVLRGNLVLIVPGAPLE
jgi:hypothetical protein